MTRPPRPLDVAIVGLACRLRGGAGLSAFWEPTPESEGAGDPGHDSLLDLVDQAMADAGIGPGKVDRLRVEEFLAQRPMPGTGGPLEFRCVDVGERSQIRLQENGSSGGNVDSRAGVAARSLTAEASHGVITRGRFRAVFMGDADASSALVATGLAARALTARRADLAIVGGACSGTGEDPDPSRREVTEASASDDAMGVVVLKRLRDAERDGDRIYAVLKGVGIERGDRRSTSGPAARRAARRAYRRSGIDPGTIGLFEGPRPPVDEADLAALQARTDATRGREDDPGATASQVWCLIRAALALHHRVLPAISEAANPPLPRAEGEPSPARGPARRPWISGGTEPRRAAVGTSGNASVQAHAILEAHPSSDGEVAGAPLRWPDEAVLVAAEGRSALIDRVRGLAERLRGRTEIELKDLAAGLNDEASRGGLPSRLGLVARSTAELVEQLDSVADRLADPARSSIRDARGAYYWELPLAEAGGLAFLFPGEGSQYPGMLADLCMQFPEVRGCFDQIDRMALASGAVEPPGSRLFSAGKAGDPALWEAGTAVHVVLGSQWALYLLLSRLGLVPDAVCGHSSGEFPALVAAGAIPHDDRLEGRLNDLAAVFSGLERSGAIPEARLLGVAADRARVVGMLGDEAGLVSVAADNCPHQVVLVGADEAIGRVASRLRAAGIASEPLPFARAYHAPAFEPAVGPIWSFFASMPLGLPRVPLYSCCLGGRVPDEVEAIRRLAVAQWTRPVEFRRTVEAMHADGIRLFVDVGARGNLAGFVEDTLRGRDAFAVATNLPRRSGLSQLNHLVASLFAQGVAIDPTVLYSRRRPIPVVLDREKDRQVLARVKVLGAPGSGDSGRADGRRVGRSGAVLSRARGGDFQVADAGRGGLLVSDQRSKDRQPQARASDVMGAEGRVGRADPAGLLAPGRRPARMEGVEGPRARSPGPNASPMGGPSRVEAPAGRSGTIVVPYCLDASGDPIAEDHTFGGRRISEVDPGLKGLPVLPFTVMAELLAEAGARLMPGAVLVGLRGVRARRWIRYETGPIRLEVVASIDPERPGEVRAALFNRGPIGAERPTDDPPAVEGIVVFGRHRPEPPEASPFVLPEAEGSRFTADSLYGEQWLFHGPTLRGVTGVGAVSDHGIEGTIRVLPRRGLSRAADPRAPLTDPIVIDAFTHLLGCWGLERLAEGDVIFPLCLGSLAIHGEDPPEGTEVSCRISIRAVDRHRVTVDAEIVRPDDRIWMRLSGWEDWRFYWPMRYRDVFRQPDRVLLGEPLDGLPAGAVAVWLEPPDDMGRPIWRDVLEQIQLAPEEREGCLRPEGSDRRRTLRLWGRIAAKEAARRLWLAEGRPHVYPADLAILPDSRGRPVLRSRLDRGGPPPPSISIAHTEGVAVALACVDETARVGIDVEQVVPRSPSFEEIAFSPAERAILDRFGSEARPEWVARFWCAREAAAKATGLGMVDGPRSVEVLDVDPGRGTMVVRLGPGLASHCPDLAGAGLEVRTARRGAYAWAWIIHEGADR